MKVIVVNDHLYPDGGADVVALSSAEGLAKAGVDVTLFVADQLREDDDTLRRAKLVCTGQSDLLNGKQRGAAALQGLWNTKAAQTLKGLLARHDPRDTVVHLHSWTKSLSSSVVRTISQAGFPLVCTLHEYFAACPNGMLFNFQTETLCELTPMSAACVATHCDARRYPHKLYRVVRQVVQQHVGGLPSLVDEFVVVSRFSEKILRPYLPAGALVHHIPNPIDVVQTTAGPLADVAASNTFVMVARLFAPKAPGLFLHACKQAGVPARCVGDGPDLEDLKQTFRHASFTGQLSRKEVTASVRAARALVLPSIWYETQGLVVAEAAAQGVPGIVPDNCAASEFVEHGRTGLVFRSGDVNALAAAIKRLADNPALAAEMGRRAAEKFWQHPPTPVAHAASLIDLYEGVLRRAAERQTLKNTLSRVST